MDNESKKEDSEAAWTERPRYCLSDDNIAAGMYEKQRAKDPFPLIVPALLNSADIAEYVAETGMICPFNPSPEKKYLKAATYAFTLRGMSIYWNEDGIKVRREINEGETFTLKARTIAFITLYPRLRLPEYMVGRFNLHIDVVYKGLLLGTGPIVDPGFDGYLSIPLHNLTDNDYTFKYDDKIIWMEFTKLSPNWKWGNDRDNTNVPSNRAQYAIYSKYVGITKDETVNNRLEAIEPQNDRVQSSIGTALISATRKAEQAKNDAEAAEKHASSALKEARNYSYFTLLGAILAVLTLWFTSWRDASSYVEKARSDLTHEREMRDKLILDLKTLNTTIADLKLNLSRLEEQVKVIQSSPVDHEPALEKKPPMQNK